MCRTIRNSEISRNQDRPANASLVLSDGSSVPVLPDSVDGAYSRQLMEHLHPDDAMDQLANLPRALLLWFLIARESPLLGMPFRLRRAVAHELSYRFLLGIRMVGRESRRLAAGGMACFFLPMGRPFFLQSR